jgi:hypothetical protein
MRSICASESATPPTSTSASANGPGVVLALDGGIFSEVGRDLPPALDHLCGGEHVPGDELVNQDRGAFRG